MKPTWDWLLTVMDATEAQLRFGASLTHTVDHGQPSGGGHSSSSSTATVGGGANSAVTASVVPLNVYGWYRSACTALLGFFFIVISL